MELNKTYQIILADPPWKYQDNLAFHGGGGAEHHYNTMTQTDICSLPIEKISSDDCVLFLWVTYPMLKEGLEVIEAWGFEYKSIAFQWIKRNQNKNGYFFGLGRWTRGNTEPCLLAVRGKPKRRSCNVFQIIDQPVGKHSQKPKIQYRLIEKLMGDLPRIELFARDRWEGWDAWGNEVSKSYQSTIKLEVLP